MCSKQKERKHSNLFHASCDVPGHILPALCPAPATAHAEALGQAIPYKGLWPQFIPHEGILEVQIASCCCILPVLTLILEIITRAADQPPPRIREVSSPALWASLLLQHFHRLGIITQNYDVIPTEIRIFSFPSSQLEVAPDVF